MTHVEARMQEKLIAISQAKITFISTYSQINGAFCAYQGQGLMFEKIHYTDRKTILCD